MTITIEAIYEAGVLRPLEPITNLKEKEKVRVKLETASVLDQLLANPIQIDPQIAREIAEGVDGIVGEVECETIVDRQRRQRLMLEPESLAELMENHETDLFRA